MTTIEDLVASHGDAVWRIAIRFFANEEDARDCYQETFLEVTRLRSQNVKNWQSLIISIATRRAMDQLRQRYRRRQVFVDSDVEPKVNRPPDQRLLDDEFRQFLRETLATMPENQAEAFWLRHMEHQSPTEIAIHLGITEGHVRVLVHRATIYLRDALATFAPCLETERVKNERE